jgi:two-component system cell cycle sensor histidine kinase/response regulator CckA
MSAHPERNGVLYAEDEEEIRGLIAMLFRAAGFTVLEAGDGREALAMFTEHRESIVALVTDLGLPGLGGVELIEGVRALSPTVRIVGMSGYGEPDVRERVLAAGGDEFIGKPFLAADLIALVQRLVAS